MIKVTVIGSEKVIDDLKRKGQSVSTTILNVMKAQAIFIQSYIKSKKLSGNPLHRRSGRLSGSIHQSVSQNKSGVKATVYTNLSYAAIHEYGFNGTVTVKQHLRTIKQAWGRPISPKQITVRSHSKKINMPERSFMRSALRENEVGIRQALQNAVNKVLKS